MLSLGATPVRATSPPAASNFCSSGICMEISELSSPRIEFITSTKNSETKVLIRNHDSTTIIGYAFNNGSCKRRQNILLTEFGGKYTGHGCVILPKGNETARRTDLEYIPNKNQTKEQAKLGVPVLDIWEIDSSPYTFWMSGYALRIASSIDMEFQE